LGLLAWQQQTLQAPEKQRSTMADAAHSKTVAQPNQPKYREGQIAFYDNVREKQES
jgi:hypothetical protein